MQQKSFSFPNEFIIQTICYDLVIYVSLNLRMR